MSFVHQQQPFGAAQPVMQPAYVSNINAQQQHYSITNPHPGQHYAPVQPQLAIPMPPQPVQPQMAQQHQLNPVQHYGQTQPMQPQVEAYTSVIDWQNYTQDSVPEIRTFVVGNNAGVNFHWVPDFDAMRMTIGALPKFTKIKGPVVRINRQQDGKTIEDIWLWTHVGYFLRHIMHTHQLFSFHVRYLPVVLRDGSIGLLNDAKKDEVYDPSHDDDYIY